MQDTLIYRDPEIMMGKPVVRGTRITVEHILRQVGFGATFEQVMSDYKLTHDQVAAAFAYAAERLAHGKIEEVA